MRRAKYSISLLFAGLLACLLVACEKEELASPIPPASDKPQLTDPELAPQTPIVGRLELPQRDNDLLFIEHKTQIGADSIITYSLEYDFGLFHANWVAYRFDNTTRAKEVTRSQDAFKDDPLLPQAYRIGNGTFREDGDYDRGHLCASADRLYSLEANQQTFYMSNMSPQLSGFNQRYWKLLEEQVQQWGRDTLLADTLYVCKGGYLAQTNLLGFVRNGLMAIPSHYYMALLAVKDDTYHSLAFWVAHENYPTTTRQEAVQRHLVSVRALEEKTGLNFFAALPEALADQVETETVVWR